MVKLSESKIWHEVSKQLPIFEDGDYGYYTISDINSNIHKIIHVIALYESGYTGIADYDCLNKVFIDKVSKLYQPVAWTKLPIGKVIEHEYYVEG